MPHRKNHPALAPTRGSKVSSPQKGHRLAQRLARGALLAVGFTALQYFTEDATEERRLFDHRVVDSLQAPLTHYRE